VDVRIRSGGGVQRDRDRERKRGMREWSGNRQKKNL
jgi:hypothetical protein